MFSENNTDESLLRYLLNESAEEERRAVEAWVSQTESNRKYFESFRRAHIYLQCTIQSDAVHKSYSHWQRRVHGRLFARKMMRIAAVIILMVGISGGVYLFRSGTTDTFPPLAQSRISPGSAQAVLYLSSGRSVTVDSCRQEIQETDGTSIRVSDQGSLSYLHNLGMHFSQSLLNKLVVPRGGEFHITLNDGTQIWLNSESELQYPTQFNNEQRIVYLKGEAYFDVAHMTGCPFVVRVADVNVKVYGTQFNINTHTTGKIETVLVKGSIGLSAGEMQEIRLVPAQKADYRIIGQQFEVEDVNILPYVAWKNGYFMFHDETLESIMEKLARWYDADVFYRYPQAKLIRLSGMMERYSNINDLLRYFEKISDARFTVKGRTVTVE